MKAILIILSLVLACAFAAKLEPEIIGFTPEEFAHGPFHQIAMEAGYKLDGGDTHAYKEHFFDKATNVFQYTQGNVKLSEDVVNLDAEKNGVESIRFKDDNEITVKTSSATSKRLQPGAKIFFTKRKISPDYPALHDHAHFYKVVDRIGSGSRKFTLRVAPLPLKYLFQDVQANYYAEPINRQRSGSEEEEVHALRNSYLPTDVQELIEQLDISEEAYEELLRKRGLTDFSVDKTGNNGWSTTIQIVSFTKKLNCFTITGDLSLNFAFGAGLWISGLSFSKFVIELSGGATGNLGASIEKDIPAKSLTWSPDRKAIQWTMSLFSECSITLTAYAQYDFSVTAAASINSQLFKATATGTIGLKATWQKGWSSTPIKGFDWAITGPNFDGTTVTASAQANLRVGLSFSGGVDVWYLPTVTPSGGPELSIPLQVDLFFNGKGVNGCKLGINYSYSATITNNFVLGRGSKDPWYKSDMQPYAIISPVSKTACFVKAKKFKKF